MKKALGFIGGTAAVLLFEVFVLWCVFLAPSAMAI